MAEEHSGCRRGGWSQACQTRRRGNIVRTLNFSAAYEGEESLPTLRASCQNFCCSHRFRRACQNQALPRETHRAGKRPGCASWPRGPAAAVAVLRPKTRPQPPTVSASNGGGSSLPRSLLWCSVALLSPFPAQVSCSSLLSHMRKDTRSVPIARPGAQFVCSAGWCKRCWGSSARIIRALVA